MPAPPGDRQTHPRAKRVERLGCRRRPGRVARAAPAGAGAGERLPDTIMASGPEEEPVSVLQRFEKRLEGLVEGAFAKVFKGVVHPVEILNAMQREAEAPVSYTHLTLPTILRV